MPVSVATQHDPFRGSRASQHKLRVPQARVLAALMPADPNDPPREWPLLDRAGLAKRAGYTTLSGSITRALNGIREGSSSGDAHLGLLALGYVEVVEVEVCDKVDDGYRITVTGVAAFQRWMSEGGKLPPLKDAESATNHRYKH